MGRRWSWGVAYEDGEGVAPDEARAIEYLSAAAQQHHSLAEHRLGLDYEIGRGVPHNRTAAIQWLRRAAADGAPVAGTTANALARARVAQFYSVEEIDAYMAPPAPKVKAGACPAFGVTQAGPRAQAMIYTFCACHPGCPYTSPGFNMTCSNAGARPYCNGSY